MKRELLRPMVHAGALGFVFLEPVLGRNGTAAAAGVAFLLNLLVLPRTPFGKALRREGEPLVNGQVTYPLAVALAWLCFPGSIAVIAWAVMALGDAAASVVGAARPGGARIPWNRRKSVAGTLAFLPAAWLGSLATLEAWRLASGQSGFDDLLAHSLLAGVAAVIGAVVESLPLPIDDNLPIVLAVGFSLSAMTAGL